MTTIISTQTLIVTLKAADITEEVQQEDTTVEEKTEEDTEASEYDASTGAGEMSIDVTSSPYNANGADSSPDRAAIQQVLNQYNVSRGIKHTLKNNKISK